MLSTTTIMSMTMLDGMRRHKGWLKWSLGLVVLAFVFLYVPGFLDETAVTGMPNNVLAKVGEHEITVAQFRQVYLAQLQQYRLQTSGEISEEVLRSLGIDRQILQSLINEYAALSEAERLGLSVSDAEVRERILSMPDFQENGQFIGEQRLQQILRLGSPPRTLIQYQEDVRSAILLQRLQALITKWITVSDEDVAEEHRRRNEKVKVEVVAFRGDDYREQVEVTDEDVQLLYDEESIAYQVPEKRKLRFLLIDEPAIFESITPTEAELKQYYDSNISQYSTPIQVRPSQILLRTEGAEEADVQARAEALTTEARGGADFAELARQHSDDEETAANGGDLGLLDRGFMLPELEAVAFDLDVGAVSDPVRSSFGFHIFTVTERQDESTQPLDDVRATIANTLKQERAASRSSALAQAISAEVSTPEDLERAASARGFEVQESGFVAPGEPILGLGMASNVSAQASQMELGEVAGPLSTPTGPAFITIVDRQDPFIPPLEDVRAEVREEVLSRKALTLAREKATEAAASLREADDFAEAARAAELGVGTSELITRGSAFPEVGSNAALEAVAFELPIGGVSDAIEVGNATAVVHVVERQDVTPAELEESRETLRGELLQNRQNQFYGSYMTGVQEQLPINIDLAALELAVGA